MFSTVTVDGADGMPTATTPNSKGIGLARKVTAGGASVVAVEEVELVVVDVEEDVDEGEDDEDVVGSTAARSAPDAESGS